MSPTGRGDGSTEAQATELQNALASENVIAGDTIIMLDGTYTGNYVSTVTGNALAKIYVKPKNYMAAIIDGYLQIGDFGGINGAYTRVRNIRCFNSNTNRGTWATPQGTISRPPNIFPAAPNVEIINCIYHDGGVGIPAYNEANGLVVYGTVGFNNGWADDVLGGAQNLYIHSLNKTVKHCVFGGAFKRSVAIYTTNAIINGITLEENVVFAKLALLMGGNATQGQVVSGSLLSNHVVNNGIQLGYDMTPNIAAICNNNRVWGNNPLTASYFQYLTMNGNKFTGQEVSGNGCFEINYTTEKQSYAINNNEYHKIGVGTAFHEGAFNGDFAGWQALGHDADGSYSTELPTVNELFVYPNEYPDVDDMRMGIVVIWNWEGGATVAVDLTDLGLEIGTTYRWRQAQDPLVDIDTWVCDGNSHTFAMTGHTVALPIGFDEELVPTQFPTFGCFIIEKVV